MYKLIGGGGGLGGVQKSFSRNIPPPWIEDADKYKCAFGAVIKMG